LAVPVQRLIVKSEQNDLLVKAHVTFPDDIYESHCVFCPVRRTLQWQRLQTHYKKWRTAACSTAVTICTWNIVLCLLSVYASVKIFPQN